MPCEIPWGPETTEKLKSLWREGLLSARQIGDEMQRSRSAILGKVWRLGLLHEGKPPPKIKVRQRGKQNRRYQPKKKQKPIVGAINNAVFDNRSADDGVAKQLVELTANSCRWPFGDPQNGFFFCGADGADMACGKPYCPAHMRIAFAGTTR